MIQEKPDRGQEYEAAVVPLRVLPKDFNAWISQWGKAFSLAQDAGVRATKDARTWIEDLQSALQPVAGDLVT